MCRDSLDGIELLARVASDLKEFSRDDKHDMQPSDINAIMDKALNLVRVELGTRIAVVRQYAELPSVMCIPSRIMQVFLILIVNSLQAISDKGTINVTTLCGCERVKAVVEDTGTGVSPENIGLMFDPFFTTKPADKGTGLGLTIAQKIVTFHGGTITATSQAGKGTTMTVELPCQQLVTGV
jgi:signal transduction histidine kinase